MPLHKIFYSILVSASFAAFTSCHKKDTFSENKLTGKLHLNDTILKKGILIPQADVDVLLSYSNNFSDYIFKTKTNNEGSFSFSYQPTGTAPLLMLAKTIKDNIIYTGISETATFSSSGSLVMYPQVSNGIKVIARDSQGNLLPNVSICLFSSQLVLSIDDCSLAVKNQTTNESGVAFFTSLSPGSFFILAKTAFGNLNLRWTGSAVTVTNSGITTLDITLTNQNGFILTINDSQPIPNPVNGVQIFGYRSKAIYLIDSTHLSSIFSLNTNNAGKASLYNIDAAQYYLRIIKQIGNTTLKKMDSVDVNNSGVTTKTIQIN